MVSVVAVSLLLLSAVLLLFLAGIGWFWFCRPANRGGFLAVTVANCRVELGSAWARFFGSVQRLVAECASFCRHRIGASAKLMLALPLLLPLVAMLFVLLMRATGVRTDTRGVALENQVVTAVLGEPELLAPPVLPPSAFSGEGGVGYQSADRDWSKLDSDFRQTVLRLLMRLEQRGVRMTLVEGYRSPARQDLLADGDKLVTRARGFESRHQFGLAVDLAPMIDGQLLISERDGRAAAAYEVLGEEAEAMGLIWGGRWSFRDLMHVEAPGVIRENKVVRNESVRTAGR